MRLMLSSVFSIGLGLPCSGCVPRPLSPALVPTGDLLPAWNYTTAAAVVRKPPSNSCVTEPIRGSLVALQLLGWRIVERPEGQRDEALWWGYFLTKDGPVWLLAMTFRDEDPRGSGSWKFGRVESREANCGRPIYSRTDAPPTGIDVVDFYRTSGAADVMRLPQGVDPGDWFHPAVMPGSQWAVRAVVIRVAAWEAVFGKKPPPEFQP